MGDSKPTEIDWKWLCGRVATHQAEWTAATSVGLGGKPNY